MNFDILRIGFSVVWMCLGAAVLNRTWLLPEALYDKQDSGFLTMSGWFAVTLGLYNLARWYFRNRQFKRRHAVSPLALPKPIATPHREPNPELDFSK